MARSRPRKLLGLFTMVCLAACAAAAPRATPSPGPGPGPGPVPAPDAGAHAREAPPAVIPLSTHGLVWSPKADLVAASASTSCGPPTGDGECKDTSQIRALDPRAPSKTMVRADGEVFGFRADGEWVVFRDRAGAALEEWSPRTGAVRPSAFAERARDARAVCLSPDDRHLVAVVEGDLTVVRARDSAEETALESRTFAPLPPTDCAFARDGKSFALAGARHVAVYRLGEAAPTSWLPIADAQHLTWSGTGELAFATRDTEQWRGVAYRWIPASDLLTSAVVDGPSAPVGRGAVILRAGCEWHRVEGRTRARLGPPAAACFHVHVHDLLPSPDGRFVAAIEGEWASRGIVTLALP